MNSISIGNSNLRVLGAVALITATVTICPTFAFSLNDVHFQNDVPTDVRRQVVEDFIFLENTNSQWKPSQLSQQFFGQMDSFSGKSYLKWILSSISAIGVITPGKGLILCQDAVACGDWQNKMMYLSPSFFGNNSESSVGARLSSYIHEARHIGLRAQQGGQHLECSRQPAIYPNMQGSLCDKYVDGAYGYQLVFLKNFVIACERCGSFRSGDAVKTLELRNHLPTYAQSMVELDLPESTLTSLFP